MADGAGRQTRPALADALAVVCCDTHCAGWWRAEIAAGMRAECDSRGASTPTATVPWAHATPADALAALVEAELLPAHWCDPERAPRWWRERCQGNERGDDDCWDSCDSGALEAPPSHAALVAVASLGADTLARAEAIVAETWRARVAWRVMTAGEIAHHHDRCSGDVPALGRSVLPLLFSVETLTATNPRFQRNSGKSWEERCPYGGDWRRGGFGTPDDDWHGVHRAWPALRALAALGLHLLAVDAGRVTLGVAALP